MERVNHPDGSTCPFCDGSGWVVVVKADEETREIRTVAERCSCMKQKQTEWLVSKAGISAMQKKYNFGNYKTKYAWQKNAKHKAFDFLKTKGGEWFFIGGQSGGGKTHLCAALTSELIRNGNDGMYMLWREESSKLKALRCDFEKYDFLLKKYNEPKLLYVDDFLNCGEGRPTDADLRLAYELINKRYMKEDSITIFSSEFLISEINEMSNAIGGRIFERARDFTLGIPRAKDKNIRLALTEDAKHLGQSEIEEALNG